MTTISAETILRSRNAEAPDHVLSTLLITQPRWIHAEGRTHRLLSIGEDFEILPPTPSLMEDPNLSRNAASSRAIPVQKMIEAILADPAVPIFWGKNIGGMQAKEELGPREKAKALEIWMRSMESAISYAKEMCALGIDDESRPIAAHKQIVNRILEPYMHIKVLVSATEWSNFLALRDHGDAEPHIAMLAREIRKCLNDESTIQTLRPGEWHIPFVRKAQAEAIMKTITGTDGKRRADEFWPKAIKWGVSCCASTSYKTVDGFDMSLDRAIALHDKLVAAQPLHASPCEHVAQADSRSYTHLGSSRRTWDNSEQHGNFVGFRQYRKMLPGECL